MRPDSRLAHVTRVLVVDDEPVMTDWLQTVIAQVSSSWRLEVRTAGYGSRAEELFQSWRPAVVVLDLNLPDIDGIELLRRMKDSDPDTEVIVFSGEGTMNRALEAGKCGAFFFIEKSRVDPSGLLGILERAVDLHRERQQHERLKERVRSQFAFTNVIGRSPLMRDLFELVDAVAASDANVLIEGENGTGKELIANALHGRSLRAEGAFIKINCAAIPKDLIESELFGYKRGAFTGAVNDKVGLLEMASGGSLMLDEVGEMPPFLQTKLLRVLQEREYRPLGSERTIRVDFRLMCATNVDLEVALRDGRLREDLYFRINTIQLRVPPLRERADDIPLLASHFVERFNARYDRSVKGLSASAHRLLARSRWPGNVRELENVIERAVLMAKGLEIVPTDLPESLRGDVAPEPALAASVGQSLAEIERAVIVQTLEATNWNKQETAQLLGLYRPTLYSKMRKHRIEDRSRVARSVRPEQDARVEPDSGLVADALEGT